MKPTERGAGGPGGSEGPGLEGSQAEDSAQGLEGTPTEDPCRKLSRLSEARRVEAPGRFPDILEDCLTREGVEHQRLARVMVHVLKGHPELRPLLDAARDGGVQGLAQALGESEGRGTAALRDPVLLLALTRMILPDLELERFLTALRRLALEGCVAGESASDSEPSSPSPPPLPPIDVLVALGRQCFLTGYVYAISDPEQRLLQTLEARLQEEGDVTPARVAVLASYKPLSEWEGLQEVIRGADAGGHSSLLPLIRQQILEPREEEALRAQIPARGEIRGRVSEEVRAHYEENPYPRWVSVDRASPGSVAEVLGDLFPALEIGGPEELEEPRILVAGCGTGQHLLQLHYRFRGARIHGVDLSLSSLAFARRKIREHGAEGITLEQADILSLAGWPERFDLVESVGVLQHLEDPVQGWRILRGLTSPGGLMKIGVYSARARARIMEARTYLAERGFGPSEESVRRARAELATRFRGDPEADFLETRDFFSMQECRDLLFHTHEHVFTLPRIKEILKEVGLEFLGFEHPDPGTRVAFRKEHPEGGAEGDLDAWHDFETRHPRTFRHLYRLWLRAF